MINGLRDLFLDALYCNNSSDRFTLVNKWNEECKKIQIIKDEMIQEAKSQAVKNYSYSTVKTQGDNIRTMSNEELVSTFTGLWQGKPVFACPILLRANIESACPYPQMLCSECFLAWLQSPVEK